VLDGAGEITDIRELFRLPLEETVQIAEAQGITHPGQIRTLKPYVMTTDFLVTMNRGTYLVNWRPLPARMAGRIPWMRPFAPLPREPSRESTAVNPSGATMRAVKGASAAVMGLTQPSPEASTTANQLEAQGFRVLAVAMGPPEAVKLAGIIALSDPPRTDSAALIQSCTLWASAP
jgi:magnesium-transporting ATPase (P-type)